MSMESQADFSPLPDEAAMAQLAYSRWERAEAETMAEYISRRRTVDLAALVRQAAEEELKEAEQQIFRMRYYENLSPLEISQRLHMHKSSVSHALANAEGRIRQRLKYVVQYQHDMLHVSALPLEVRKAIVVSAARYGCPTQAAQRLRQLRIGENLTVQDVAQTVGISVGRLIEIEDGQALPDCCELLRLAEFYGVCADAVLKGDTPCRHH